MGKILQLFLVVACVINFTYMASLPATNRIVNGKPAQPGQIPHQVLLSINFLGGRAVCGGSLISDRWVITAAHCAVNARSFEITLGAINYSNFMEEEGRVVVTSSKYIVHERYDPQYAINDVALIQLPYSITVTDKIRPILLPNRTDDALEGETVVASGWGLQSSSASTVSSTLQYASLEIISNEECEKTYTAAVIRSTTICARGRQLESVCNGDSGGPLYAGSPATLIGVTSFGHVAGCDFGIPVGFSRVTKYLDWISANIRNSV